MTVAQVIAINTHKSRPECVIAYSYFAEHDLCMTMELTSPGSWQAIPQKERIIGLWVSLL